MLIELDIMHVRNICYGLLLLSLLSACVVSGRYALSEQVQREYQALSVRVRDAMQAGDYGFLAEYSPWLMIASDSPAEREALHRTLRDKIVAAMQGVRTELTPLIHKRA